MQRLFFFSVCSPDDKTRETENMGSSAYYCLVALFKFTSARPGVCSSHSEF